MRQLLLAFVLVFVAGLSALQAGEPFEEILVPLAFNSAQQVSGAKGTIWSGEVYVYNGGAFTLLHQVGACTGSCLGYTPAGYAGPILVSTDYPQYGLILTPSVVPAKELTFSARIFERSQRGQPRGIDIPVVREREFFTTTKVFLAVPSDDGVRSALRIYDPRATAETAPRFEVRLQGPKGEDLGSTVVEAKRPVHGIPQAVPGFVFLDLSTQFSIAAHPYVNVFVTPVVPGTEYWAMVSTTDNDTQTVSIITAQ